MIRTLQATFLTLVIATTSAAQTPTGDGGDIERKLDNRLSELSIKSQPIPAALTEIGRTVGVRIDIDDDAAALLPWGRETKVADVRITQATLREALPQILLPLGMTHEVEADRVLVVATSPLKRVNRRATWEDLRRLRWCNDTEYSPEILATVEIQYRISSKVDAPKLLERQLERAGRGSVAEMLETACGSLGWVWLPEGDTIVVRTYEAQVANQLARRIDARYMNMPLSRIVNDLARRADVALFLEPGMMRKLPTTTAQSCTLLLDRGTIRQAFELLAAETGIDYAVTRDGIKVGLSAAIEGGGAISASQRSGYVGKISIPNSDGSYQFEILLRAEDLPPDLLEYREELIDEFMEKMRHDMEQREEAKVRAAAETTTP